MQCLPAPQKLIGFTLSPSHSKRIDSRGARRHRRASSFRARQEAEVVLADIAVHEDLSLSVHDADVHVPGVKIDAAVEFRLGLM